jgi:integrase
MPKSTGKQNREKPVKPYPDFPLFPHASGRWAKKIKGKTEYFGSWADGWKDALDNYKAWRDDLYSGRRPSKDSSDRFSVRDLCNQFRTSKQSKRDAGELVQQTYVDYVESCDRIIRVFGKNAVVEDLRPPDFARLRADIVESYSTPAGVGNEVNRCRVVFNFAKKNRLVNDIWFGDDFKRPPRHVERRALAQKRQTQGAMMFEAAEVHQLLAGANKQLTAMILLAINCGLDNASVGRLATTDVRLKEKWLDSPRFKTGVERQCPLWDETVKALEASMEDLPTPKPGSEYLVFLTRCGTGWYKGKSCPLSLEFRRLMEAVGVYRSGRGFRALRHTFETIASGSRDQVAVNHIMGHADHTMAAVYRETIARSRLQAVVDHVHNWLWPPAAPKKRAARKKTTSNE